MAMINGLRNYSISTMRTGLDNGTAATVAFEALITSEVASLMSPTENYVNYRRHYKKYPGIPFLIPHIRDFKHNGDAGLEPVLQFLQRN